MKKTKRFLLCLIIVLIIALISLFFIDLKTVLSILFFFILLLSYFFYKEKIGQELVIAFILSLTLTSYYFYQYVSENLIIGKINLFPLAGWTFGLVFLREIYEKTKLKNKFLKITAIYLIGLFVLEYIGYYLLGIRLDSNFSSLFNLGIIHAPVGMKIVYLTLGPIYLLITDYLKVK